MPTTEWWPRWPAASGLGAGDPVAIAEDVLVVYLLGVTIAQVTSC